MIVAVGRSDAPVDEISSKGPHSQHFSAVCGVNYMARVKLAHGGHASPIFTCIQRSHLTVRGLRQEVPIHVDLPRARAMHRRAAAMQRESS
eukprot:COSAG05_NODE_1904_length_3853_cov_9.683957_2_plen_91_part_00